MSKNNTTQKPELTPEDLKKMKKLTSEDLRKRISSFRKTKKDLPPPTEPLKGREYIPKKREPTPEDLEKLPPKIGDCPRWIYASELMSLTELCEAELKNLIENNELKAFTPDNTIYVPYSDRDRRKDLKLGWVDVFEAEERDLLVLTDTWDVMCWRKAYQESRQGSAHGTSPKKVEAQKSVDLKKDDRLNDPRLIKLLKEVKPKMEFLFEDLQDMAGFGYADNNTDREMRLEKRAIELLNDPETKLNKFFKRTYFTDPKIYNTEPKQTPRDFIGALLRKIVNDRLHIKIGGQALYDIYKKI
jgi:hypothetical protein